MPARKSAPGKTKSLEQRILDIVAPLTDLLELSGTDIHHRFSNELDPSDSETQAKTADSWQYREATITWYLQPCSVLSDEALLLLGLHEYSHVLIGPIFSFIPDDNPSAMLLNELATENIARALRGCLRWQAEEDE